MSRKIILLNILLAGLLIWLGVEFRKRWMESKAREAEVLARAAKPAQVATPPAVPGVDPASPAQYIDVAQRMLFSKDRDPNVILEPPPAPPPPPPEKPTPPLPSYYGQMNFGEPEIMLATAQIPQKRYRKGDKVGDFKLAAFDGESVTLEWEEKTIVSKLQDLRAKEPERPVQQAAAPPPAANQNKSITRMGGNNEPKQDPSLGPMNGLFATCLPDDPSPDGTIKNGYRKKITPSMMGPSCMWEPISR